MRDILFELQYDIDDISDMLISHSDVFVRINIESVDQRPCDGEAGEAGPRQWV